MLKLEGRLTDVWAAEAEAHWHTALTLAGSRPMVVDMRDVLSVDPAGRRLLAQMRRDGARFEVAGCAMRALVDELNEAAAGEAREPARNSGRATVGKDVSGAR